MSGLLLMQGPSAQYNDLLAEADKIRETPVSSKGTLTIFGICPLLLTFI